MATPSAPPARHPSAVEAGPHRLAIDPRASRRARGRARSDAAERGKPRKARREAGGTPDPQTSNGWHLQFPCTRFGRGLVDVDVARPRDRGHRSVCRRHLRRTLPVVDHAKSRPATSTAFPTEDPAWRWDDATHGTQTWPVDSSMTAWAGFGVNPTLRIAATRASRNGGYFTPNTSRAACVGPPSTAFGDERLLLTSTLKGTGCRTTPEQGRRPEGPACRRLRDVEGVIKRRLQATGRPTDNPPATRPSPGDTWGAFERDVTAPAADDAQNLAPRAAAARGRCGLRRGRAEPTSWSNPCHDDR